MKKVILLAVTMLILTLGYKSAAAQAPSPMQSSTVFMSRQIAYNSMTMNRMMTRRANKKRAAAKKAIRKNRRHNRRVSSLYLAEPALRAIVTPEKAAIV